MSNSGALARPRRADPITGVSPSLNACSMTLTVRTRAWPGRVRGKRHRAGHWELARVHGLTGWKEARRLDLGQQCSARVLEWRAGWQQQAAAPAIRDPLLSNLQFPFSHSPPQTPPATTTTAPFAPSRHADTARADLSQHRRRPVTRFPLPSIAHRPLRPAPTSIANSRFQGVEGPKFKVTRNFPADHPSQSSREEQPAGQQHSRRNPHLLPRSQLQQLSLFQVSIIPSLLPSKTSQHLQGTRAGNTLPGDGSRHRSVRPSAIRPPPSALHPPPSTSAIRPSPSAICHRPSPLRGAVAWPAARPTERHSLPCCCSVLGGHAIAGLPTEEFIALLLRSSLHHVRFFSVLSCPIVHGHFGLHTHPTHASSMLAAALLACP